MSFVGVKYYKGKKFHREGGAAKVSIRENNQSYCEYYIDGKCKRIGKGPTRVIVTDDRVKMWTLENGDPHSIGDRPSVIIYHKYGRIKMWHKEGILHRENGKPAMVEVFNNNEKDSVYKVVHHYYENDEKYNEKVVYEKIK